MRKIIGILLVILLISPLILYVLWFLSPTKSLNILILDKTVLESKGQEHRSFDWVLINEKYVHSKNIAYNLKNDYFGFFPNDSGLFRIKDFNRLNDKSLDSLANKYDMVYYTDLYGIYKGEWNKRYSKNSPNKVDNSLEHTGKIYGGMTQTEFDFLKKMKSLNKLIITEYNSIESPTPVGIRHQFENEFNIKWTGWIGRYFETLDTLKNKELPIWLKRNYLLQHKSEWPFKKSGIVFVREDDKIEILENETHLLIDVPIIHTDSKFMKYYHVPAEMKYPFWFDIISTNEKNTIVANYQINTNETGHKLLKLYGIPETFPSVIKHESTDYKFYYFAGDFCDNSIGIKTSKFKWIEHFSQFSYTSDPQERKSFFWNYYRPMTKKILSEYYKDLK